MPEPEHSGQTVKLNIIEKLEIISCFQNEYVLGHIHFLPRRAHLILGEDAFYNAPLSLTNRIRQLRRKGYKLQVELSPKEIPSGYSGIELLYHGARLKSQKYLKIQREYVEKIVAYCL